MSHRAPSAGYKNGPKNQYRRNIWAQVERDCDVPLGDRKVLILDTREGREVEELLRRGYTSSNITVVNDNAADVALLQRKFATDSRMRGRLDTHGIPLRSYLERRHGHKFDVINLDYCSPVCSSVINDIATMSTSGLIGTGTVFAFNVQRGRESIADVREDIGRVKEHEHIKVVSGRGHTFCDPRDGVRLKEVLQALLWGSNIRSVSEWGRVGPCQWHIRSFRFGSYRSLGAKVTMLWGVAKLVSCDTVRDLELASVVVGSQLFGVDFRKILIARAGHPWCPLCIFKKAAAATVEFKEQFTEQDKDRIAELNEWLASTIPSVATDRARIITSALAILRDEQRKAAGSAS